MEGGQWQSEVYDEETQDQQKPGGYPTEHHSPPVRSPATAGHRGAARAMYNSPAPQPASAGRLGVLAVTLRVAQVLLTLIGFAIMAANKQTIYDLYVSYYYSSSEAYTLSFTSVKAFVALLSLDSIVCVYAIVQVVMSVVQKATQGSFVSSPTAGACLITFIFDMVLAHALGAACGAAAAAAALLKSAGFCKSYEKFCQKGNASIAISFLAWVALVLSSVLYTVRLLRALRASRPV